jgi:LmbE family N-acetylglucosaminyl deacetylase
MKWLFLSPHLDDAVLSCGGLIEVLGARADVTVCTFFCHAPWFGGYSAVAKWLHQVSGGVSARRLASIRREEDRIACRGLNAHHRHLQWQDAVYRKSREGEFLYDHCIQRSWALEDETLISQLASEIQSFMNEPSVLLVPLGIGGHVDHLVVRAAAERSRVKSIVYYADVPYSCLDPQDLQQKVQDLNALAYRLSVPSVEAWIKAIQSYQSQIHMLETAAGPLDALIRLYASSSLRLYTADSGFAQVVAGEIQDHLIHRERLLRSGER